jgi:hypothetical protein
MREHARIHEDERERGRHTVPISGEQNTSMLHIKQRLVATAIFIGGATMLGANAAPESLARQSTNVETRADGSATAAANTNTRRGVSIDVERYANRERVTPALGNFRGGDTIGGGASSIALILAIVLVLVLI